MANLESIRQAGYTESQKPHRWNDTRLFYPAYVQLLPTYRGQKVDKIIDSLIQANISDPVTILDLGCGGMGYAIKDCAEHWRGLTRCTGVDGNLLPESRIRNPDQVEFITGDIQNAAEILPINYFDLIMSLRVIPYLPDPFRVVLETNKLLKSAGISLLDRIPLTPVFCNLDTDEQIAKFILAFSRVGIEVTTEKTIWRRKKHVECNLSFQKLPPETILPIEYTGITRHQYLILDRSMEDVYEFESCVYRFTG